MIQEIFQAFLLIFIAEMGDKTQILAMAFATRYPMKKVLLGIFIGSFLNHGIAVALGSYISNFVPIETVQVIAGFAFVVFSLWTLRAEEEEEDLEEEKIKFGPVLTVALAFFIGELGDKTQLAAITLGSNATYPLGVLAGTVTGMIVTGGLGIIVGRKLGDRIPEFTMKLVAASVFMFFGITKLYQSLPEAYISVQYILIFTILVGSIVFYLLRTQIIRRREGKKSAYLKQSQELYEYYQHMKDDIDNICLGIENCKNCQGKKCIIGYAKEIIDSELNNNDKEVHSEFKPNEISMKKKFNKNDAIDSLVDTLKILKSNPDDERYIKVNVVRKQLELLLFKESIEEIDDFDSYEKKIKKINSRIAKEIFSKI